MACPNGRLSNNVHGTFRIIINRIVFFLFRLFVCLFVCLFFFFGGGGGGSGVFIQQDEPKQRLSTTSEPEISRFVSTWKMLNSY